MGNAARKVAIMGLVLGMAIVFIGTAAIIWCCMKNFTNQRVQAPTQVPQYDTLRAQPVYVGGEQELPPI